MIEQAEDIKQGAFPTAGRADDRVDRARFQRERNPAQRMHAFLLFAEVTLDRFAAQTDFVRHTLEPRRVAIGGS